MAGTGYSVFRNDDGVPELRIGVREFASIGVSPPQYHPHVYIDMAVADTILDRVRMRGVGAAASEQG